MCHFFFDQDLFELIDLVIGMDFCQVGKLIDKLSRMNVEMLCPAFLADQPLGAFGVDAHVFAYLLVNITLGVD